MIAQRDKSMPELDDLFGNQKPPRFLKKHLRLTLTAVGAAAASLALYCWFAVTHLPPNLVLGTVPVGLSTYEQALEKYESQSLALPTNIELLPEDAAASRSATVTAQELNLRRDPKSALDEYQAAQSTPINKILAFSRGLLSKTEIRVPTLFDQHVLDERISQVAVANFQPGRDPSVTLATSGAVASLQVDAGQLGLEIDSTASAQIAEEELQKLSPAITLPVKKTGRVLSPEEVQAAKERAARFVGKRIAITAERLDLGLNDKEIIGLINPPNGWNDEKLNAQIVEWQKLTGTQPVEPELTYDPVTLKVSSFTPPRSGRTIQTSETATQIYSALEELEQNAETKTAARELALSETPPTHSLASLNQLGINERIGLGESHYAHSIPNRIHNVAITSERINNVIIPPGAEFSFNKTLGEVSAATGYRSAYVIKNGKTELGDGGGVCQVSTTVFRAAMNAGVQITKRLPHSYRVSYYELDSKPGADATVYAGDVDFRFKNDTPGHILLHSVADSKNTYMYVELYGTSDGRYTKIVEHKTWDARPAPAPQYFPDPSLPPGKLVQIDWSAPGIRASITNVIYDKNNTEIRRDVFTSNYRPWSAKFLQGIDPAAPTQ